MEHLCIGVKGSQTCNLIVIGNIFCQAENFKWLECPSRRHLSKETRRWSTRPSKNEIGVDRRTYETCLRVCRRPLISVPVATSWTPYSARIGWPTNRNGGVLGERLTFFSGIHSVLCSQSSLQIERCAPVSRRRCWSGAFVEKNIISLKISWSSGSEIGIKLYKV